MQSHKIRADLKEKFKIKNLFLLKKGNDYFIFRSGFEIYSVYFNIEDFNSVKERLEKLDKNFEEYDLKLIIISIEKEGLLNYIKKKLISDYFIIKFVKLIKKIHNKYNTKLENFNYITQIRYDCKLDDENFVNENLDKIQNLLLNIKTV
ncbi:hypothetical protein HOK68_04940, partial [Candidatus Woesearchaeota archaeon]|nr:hypothetical protein [Candidatus Woesearchaeota archaeon]